MKKIILLLIAISFIAFVCYAGNKDNEPKTVAKQYLEKIIALDFAGAKKQATSNTVELINLSETLSNLMSDSLKTEALKVKVEILDEKIDGNNAVVTYLRSDFAGNQTLKLIKVEGKWLVNQSKDDELGVLGEKPKTDKK
jgi:hypothetical protein